MSILCYSSASNDLKEYIPSLSDFCHRSVRSYDGCENWYDVSYENEYEDCAGNDEVPFKNGNKYEDLLQIFKNDIPYNNFFFDTPVTKIDYNDTDNIQVFTKDGAIFKADIVIFTASLGILKENGFKLFDPILPDEKLQAIDSIGFGTVDKIYIEFSDPILDSKCNWNFLFNDKGISYSAEDAVNDWTRFLLGSYVINAKLTSVWLSGNYFYTCLQDDP